MDEHGTASPTPIDESPTAPDRRRVSWKRIIQVAVMLIVLGFIFGGVIPKFADYHDIWAAVSAMEWWVIVGLLGLALAYLTEYWLVIMTALPGLRLGEAAVVHTSTTAVVNTVPAGAAISFGLMYAEYFSWGFPPTTTTAALLVTGVWDNLTKIAIPAVVLGAMAWVTETTRWWIMAGAAVVFVAVVIGLVIVLLRAPVVADKIGLWLCRPVNAVLDRFHREPIDVVAKIHFFRRSTNTIIAGRWWILTLLTVASQGLLVMLLVASIRAAGVSSDVLGFILILTAYAVARVLAAVPITPGGLGIVEVAYLSILTPAVPDQYRARVAAGVLLYRALVWFPPVLLGIPALVFWRLNKNWRRDAFTEPRGPRINEEPPSATCHDEVGASSHESSGTIT